MYKEIKGIDVVVYINKNDNKLYMLDLASNKDATVENTGEPWIYGAYGNCLIALKHAKPTDRLYLLTKENISNMGKVNIKDTKELENKLMQHATRIIER